MCQICFCVFFQIVFEGGALEPNYDHVYLYDSDSLVASIDTDPIGTPAYEFISGQIKVELITDGSVVNQGFSLNITSKSQ